eukprot:752812-Hanusia_phi.AAC.6
MLHVSPPVVVRAGQRQLGEEQLDEPNVGATSAVAEDLLLPALELPSHVVDERMPLPRIDHLPDLHGAADSTGHHRSVEGDALVPRVGACFLLVPGLLELEPELVEEEGEDDVEVVLEDIPLQQLQL